VRSISIKTSVRRFGYLSSSLALTLLLAGCVTPAAYKEPITRFQQASTVVIEVARIEYNDANGRERNALIDDYAAKRLRIDLTTLNSEEIRLLGADDLAARMAALDALSKHGQLLLALASSDAPTRAKAAANSLDEAVVGLSKSLGNTPSDEFKAKAGAFTAIAGEIVKLALDKKITEALDKAIISSKNDIPALISVLREEMSALHVRRRAILSNARVAATDDYNDLVKAKASDAALQKAAAEIKKTEQEWDRLPLQLGAGPSFDAMTNAHLKLVEYAESPKKPQDLSELVDAIDVFVGSAKIIADSIKIIRNDKE
jgi:hypothetical protein